MKNVKDIFSDQSGYYKKFRPTYPKELYQEMLKHTTSQKMCWDCGTGNGQVAVELSKYFEQVYATDISETQLLKAENKKNIIYKVERAEKTNFDSSQFDLVTAAQCIHWFDQKQFFKEVKRVAKNGAILSVWGYGVPRINKTIDELLNEFYWDIVGEYWDEERQHIDNEYKSIKFDFDGIHINKKFAIKTNWTIKEFEGYLNSWSSVNHYKQINKKNPVGMIIKKMKVYWDTEEFKSISFPVFMKIVKIAKENS